MLFFGIKAPDRPRWEGMRRLWITELLRWIKPQLPDGFHVYIGSAQCTRVERPDVGVRV